jgi:hypothetical protein
MALVGHEPEVIYVFSYRAVDIVNARILYHRLYTVKPHFALHP